MPTQEQILQALRAVQDPDLRRDIVSLGFVKNLAVSGGRAYVLDKERVFEKRVNLELVELHRLEGQEDVDNVRALLERHFVSTKSNLALEILTNWDDTQELFWMVVPRGAGAKLELAVSAKEG